MPAAAERIARAVWDALLAEGQLRYTVTRSMTTYHTWEQADLCEPNGRIQRVLVIPLPVVEPRDTEQQA